MYSLRKTKIICTLGPAVNDENKIGILIEKGMDAARLNMSHGSHNEHKKFINIVRKLSRKFEKNIPVIADIQGPKIRLGDLKEFEVFLKEGNKFKIVNKEIIGDDKYAYLENTKAFDSIKKGEKLYLNDGLVCLRVIEKRKDEINCIIENSGLIRSRTGLNLPDTELDMQLLTEKDIQDIKFAIEEKVDYIALSFVRKPDDIISIKKLIQSEGSDIPIIAKIEKPQAVENIDEIIEVSEAIIVARGDLGIEISPEKVPVVQKSIVRKCIEKCRPVIIASQILDSMIRNPTPTRAEASDAANSVFDSVDCLLLSDETAIGKYPAGALEMLDKIISKSEEKSVSKAFFRYEGAENVCEAIASAAYSLSKNINAKYIVSITHSGKTALNVARCRPAINIVAVSDDEYVLNRLGIVKGVLFFKVDKIEKTELFFKKIEKKIESLPNIAKDDKVVITAGIPTLEKGSTNTLKVFEVEKGADGRIF